MAQKNQDLVKVRTLLDDANTLLHHKIPQDSTYMNGRLTEDNHNDKHLFYGLQHIETILTKLAKIFQVALGDKKKGDSVLSKSLSGWFFPELVKKIRDNGFHDNQYFNISEIKVNGIIFESPICPTITKKEYFVIGEGGRVNMFYCKGQFMAGIYGGVIIKPGGKFRLFDHQGSVDLHDPNQELKVTFVDNQKQYQNTINGMASEKLDGCYAATTLLIDFTKLYPKIEKKVKFRDPEKLMDFIEETLGNKEVVETPVYPIYEFLKDTLAWYEGWYKVRVSV